MSESKWIQGTLVKQVYKDGVNKFHLRRNDGSTFGIMYQGAPLSFYESGTQVQSSSATLVKDGEVKVYNSETAPIFRLKEQDTTSINQEGEVVPNPKIRELTVEELTLAACELILVNTLNKSVEEVRVLMQALAFKRISG
jgi:hypothetical protein